MQEYTFTITVDVVGKNKQSAKNKIAGWLDPSLSLKKNEDIILSKVTMSSKGSDEETPKEEKSTKSKRKLSLNKKSKEEEQEWDDSWDELDWDNMGEEDIEDEGDVEEKPRKSTSPITWDDDDEEDVPSSDDDDIFDLNSLRAKPNSDDEDDDDEDDDEDDEDDDEDWDWDDDDWDDED